MAVTREYGIKNETTGALEYIDIGAKAENVILTDGQKLSDYIENNNEGNFQANVINSSISFEENTTIDFNDNYDPSKMSYLIFEGQYRENKLEQKKIKIVENSTYQFSYHIFKDNEEIMLSMALTFGEENNLTINTLREQITTLDTASVTQTVNLYEGFNHPFTFTEIVGSAK